MGVLVSASFNNKTYNLAKKQKALNELPVFDNTGMAEGDFNREKEIFLSDDAPSYWIYTSQDEHRFNEVNIYENRITAVRAIKYLYDVNTKETISVSDVKKPLYLVFISAKYNEKWERTEMHRQYVEIKWE